MKNIMHEETYKNGEVSRYERPRRRRTGGIIALVIFISLLVILIAGGLGTGYRLLNPTAIRTTTETSTFHLVAGVQPMLIVSDNNGFVHVRPGAGNIVTVTATKVGDGFGANPGDFNVSYSQSGNTITIQVTNDSIHFFDFSASSQADLDVTVPAGSDLQLETGSGEITATGIQGKMTLTSNSGSLQATDVLLTSGSHLSTGSGSMLVRGSIGTDGQYKFQSHSGDIDVSLPHSTSFHVDLVSNSGTITNDFPIATTHPSGADGRQDSGDVGSSPQAIITLQSDSGSLHLRQI